MGRPYVEPSHRLPDADWAKVVARAEEIAAETAANAQGGASGLVAPIKDMTAMGIASKKYFGVSGIPTQLLVLHSGECPLRGGYAQSLTEWAGGTVHPAPPTASWQWFVDPLMIVYFIPAHLGAWHASEANVLSEGFEQAGYARMSREEWLTADGQVQIESLAWIMAQRAIANGIPLRWLTNDEVTRATNGDRSIKGFCTHRQIDPETRTDPGNAYPFDVLTDRIASYMTGGTPTPTPEIEDPDMLTIYRDTAAADPGKTWIGNGLFRRHVRDPKELENLQIMAREGKMTIFADGKVQILPTDLFGVDISVLTTGDDAEFAAVLNKLTEVKAAVDKSETPTVSLTAEDIAALAATLQAALPAGLAADLARRLAD